MAQPVPLAFGSPADAVPLGAVPLVECLSGDTEPAGSVAFLAPVDQHERQLVDDVTQVLGEAVLDELGGYRLPPGFKLSVVIPVYNERATIREIVRRVQAVSIPKEIIVIDDSSSDGTRQILEELACDAGLRVLFHERNQGKGAALRTGLAEASGDVILIQDADLEYDPQEYPRLLRPIVEGAADVVYGSRFLAGSPGHQTWRHRVANALLTWLSNRFTRLELTDMETCHKVFRRSAVAGIEIQENRFGVEPELTAKIARRGARIVEVPISYRGRSVAEGKKIRLQDAFNALYCIVRYSWAD